MKLAALDTAGRRLHDLSRNIGREKMVEILALNSFSYLTAAPIELIVGGVDFGEHFRTRLSAVFTNTVTANLYSQFRRRLLNTFDADSKKLTLRRYSVDSLAFASFQLPIYCLNMLIGGVEIDEGIRSALTVAVLAGLAGGPYGMYEDFLKKKLCCPDQNDVLNL